MWALAAFLLLFQADYTTEGMKALDEGRYEPAVTAFRKVIEGDSKDYFAHFNLAMALTMLQRDPEAVAEYRKTLELKPGLYEAELNGGMVLLRQKNPAEALPLLEDAAARKPQEFRPRYFLAEAQLQTGDFSKAEESYQAAIALDPKSAPAQLGVAQALVQQGRIAEADGHFRQAAQLEPKYRDYLLELAALYEKASETGQAIAIYREFPNNPAVQARLGELLLESKQFEDAVPRLEEAFGKDPSPDNRSALAAAYVFTRKLDKALPLLEQSVAAEPGNYDLRMMYARALRDKRQFQPAARQFYEAAKLKPAEPKPWTELGGMLYMAGDLPQALSAFEQAARNGENAPGNWFLRAIILDKLRQTDNRKTKLAKEAYEHFLALSQGKSPDQEFQARQRAKILQRELDKR
jgi:tetratricopeptide (TPR) repeat protein